MSTEIYITDSDITEASFTVRITEDLLTEQFDADSIVDLYTSEALLDCMSHGDVLDWVERNVDDDAIIEQFDGLTPDITVEHIFELLDTATTTESGRVAAAAIRRMAEAASENERVLRERINAMQSQLDALRQENDAANAQPGS